MQLHDLAKKNVLFWGAGREASAFVHAITRLQLEMQLTIADEHVQPGQTVEGRVVASLTPELLDAADVVVRSPGVSRYRPELQNRTVTTATDLWFGEPHAPAIGVTGTKGKSTTASLIAHILQSLGINAQLAGNIGRSPLDLLGEPQPDWWVLELSSFQSSDLQHSPEIGVLTNLSPEHLDWHGDYQHYVADKLNMFKYSTTSIINNADAESLRVTSELPSVQPVEVKVTEGWLWLGEHKLFARQQLQLQGAHNEQLLCLALSAVMATGVDIVINAERIGEGLLTFAALPHRLNPIGEHNGVEYVDDSLSTTPVAAIAAMEAFAGRDVTLLAGGYDRGLDYNNLAKYVASHENVRVITLPDSGTRIAEAIRANGGVAREAESLENAVMLAAQHTPQGGLVLLSPAAPSFGHFKDYAERGDMFAQLVNQIADE